MRPPIGLAGQWLNCVECYFRREPCVPRSSRPRPSRHDQIPVQPGHDRAQRLRLERVQPERCEPAVSPPLGKATAKAKREALATRLQPVPPATHGAPVQARSTAAAPHRGPGEQPHQHRLLQRPVVPPARWHALGQPRAGPPTRPAAEARNWHRIERLARGRTTVSLAQVHSVAPQAAHPAARAGRRSVQIGVVGEGAKVLCERSNAGYNPQHRLGSLWFGVA